MIEIMNKEDCCGCAACAQYCPFNAIEMKYDKQGFLYPNVDINKCINCRKCEHVCPIFNIQKEKEVTQKAYLVQHSDLSILKDSTSGGAFTAIAESILNRNGVVFGAAYDSDFKVIHMYIEDKKDLYKLRNSKYVQSEIRASYKEVKRFLSEERFVCFSGTPCQIEGLLNYLGEISPYLLTVDVVCHGVPSPAVWNTYLNILKKKNNHNIQNLRFRDKSKYGYLYSQFVVSYKDVGKNIYEGIDTNIMLRAFFSEICDRPSCYNCQFKKKYRRSDITIWDCFDVREFSDTKIFHSNLGVSRMLVHSKQAEKYLDEILSNCIYEEITPENALHFDAKEIFESVEKNKRYEEFWESFYMQPQSTLIDFFPVDIKCKIEALIRNMAYKTGIYTVVRAKYKKIFGNKKR